MKGNHNTKAPAATKQDFPIVGVGASAGGLNAFRQFLSAVPEDSGMAYVLVQHLYPGRESILPEILSRATTVPVVEITDDIHLAPNHVYVIPENKILTSTDGVLKLSPRDTQKKNQAIDVFFTSLAEVHLSLAVGVILSGRGTDGTLGLKAIKGYGGNTFVQEPRSAEYAEMPQAAINAAVADFVLPAEAIPAKIFEAFQLQQRFARNTTTADDENTFTEIIQLLCTHSGVDFTNYKQTTIRRRIARRMAISKTVTLTEYLKFLRGDKTAPGILFNDLLIPVTSFFRDPAIFSSVQETVFPAIMAKKNDASSLRIWTAGCSTGEEAYTMAIAANEFLGDNPNGIAIQIFASDISELSIAKARLGFYSTSQVANLSEAILKKYFTKKNTGYQINRQIRDLCIFAVHNFLKDPPFAKMDLITCRNVLIYMDIFLQKKALTTFHYALSENGFLLLGKSETAAPTEHLFLPMAKTGKIFSRKPATGRLVHQAMINKKEFTPMNVETFRKEALKSDFIKSAEKLLLSNYTPASVVVNKHYDIVHIQGTTAPFLELSSGKPSFNLLKLARPGLTFEIRNGLHKVNETNELVIKEGILVQFEGKTFTATMEIQLLPDTAEPHFLVLFYKTLLPQTPGGSSLLREKIFQMEKELTQTHADMNAIAEGQDAINEELQSVNEELLSGSEELQSLNEELETSKEELQASNEELINSNHELVKKQELINISRNYTEAIVATLREPIVVLDTNLRIKNINRAFSKKYNIAKEEAQEKLIYEIQNHIFDNAPMRVMLEKVLPEKTQLDDYQITINLLPYGESIMLLNARQVTNEESKEQLILLAIEDITERRIIEARLQTLSDGFESKVKERTADLEKSNADLEISVGELHTANMQLQQFAYVASHDLQEPLRKILTFINILKTKCEKLPEKSEILLEKINSSSERMRTLIRDLLEYSYLDNHENLFVDVDLNVIMQNVLIDFELLIEQKQVEIITNKLPVLHAIPLQMNQLFYNVLSNALKFSAGNRESFINILSRKLTASQLRKYPDLDKEKAYFEIIISDNGIGFDQQYEKKIFTIFQRLHSTDNYNGTGIGLSISQKIVDNHGGLIYAIAEENVGAAFHIILPAQAI